MAEPKREVVLLPGQSANVRLEKGNLRPYLGPYKWDLGTYDALVVWDRGKKCFREIPLERVDEAIQQATVVPEGWYAVLTNPASKESEAHPEAGRGNDMVELRVGEKVNIHGPAMFALWPGQQVELIRGHHLSRNEFVRIKVYDPTKARANWTKAAVSAEAAGPAPSHTTESEKASFFSAPPPDLATGKQYNVRGDEVSFYMPPTGISVVPESAGAFLREAVTLQLLQYCILEDESGNKRYVHGPDVVFPEPTEQFREDRDGARVFRAIELDENSGIHLKFSRDGALTFVDGQKRSYRAGEELFVTGRQMPIYFPEEGHAQVGDDDQIVHLGTSVAAGEGRYVQTRSGAEQGRIRIERGPQILLPDPTKERIVQRVLTDQEVIDWYPGPNSTGSRDALEWNRKLRAERDAALVAFAQGAEEHERLIDRPKPIGAYAASRRVASAAAAGAAPVMDGSLRSRPQRTGGDVAARRSAAEPVADIVDTRFRGVPPIDLWPGFAVSVKGVDGSRRTIRGPQKVLLEWGETLDTLQVSTGKPKHTDPPLQRVTYLNVQQNRIGDIVEVMTADNVRLDVKISYVVDFQGDPSKWFTISNFVKHLCDRCRSMLKALVRRLPVEEFYAKPIVVIRDLLLGTPPEEGANRPGLPFSENGMYVSEVDVLSVEVKDPQIQKLLDDLQRGAIVNAVAIRSEQARLHVEEEKQEVERQLLEEKAQTEVLQSRLAIEAENRSKERTAAQKLQVEVVEALADFRAAAQLARDRRGAEQELALDRDAQAVKLEHLQAETAAIVARTEKFLPGFCEALLALQHAETVEKVARAVSPQMLFGGESLVEVFRKVTEGTPLGAIVDRALRGAAKQLSTNGEPPVHA